MKHSDLLLLADVSSDIMSTKNRPLTGMDLNNEYEDAASEKYFNPSCHQKHLIELHALPPPSVCRPPSSIERGGI